MRSFVLLPCALLSWLPFVESGPFLDAAKDRVLDFSYSEDRGMAARQRTTIGRRVCRAVVKDLSSSGVKNGDVSLQSRNPFAGARVFGAGTLRNNPSASRGFQAPKVKIPTLAARGAARVGYPDSVTATAPGLRRARRSGLLSLLAMQPDWSSLRLPSLCRSSLSPGFVPGG